MAIVVHLAGLDLDSELNSVLRFEETELDALNGFLLLSSLSTLEMFVVEKPDSLHNTI